MKNIKNNKKLIWFGAIALVSLIALTIINASGGDPLRRGSSYTYSPNGYAAWYNFMQQKGANIQRWQRPVEDLLTKNNITLLQVNEKLNYYQSFAYQDWIKKGNTVVMLGIKSPATKAKFTQYLPSDFGDILIKTTRRFTEKFSNEDEKSTEKLLSDDFGDVVISYKIGKGKLIIATTAYIGANAYQNEPSNYEFLAKLVNENNHQIFVDEYMHGYRDQDVLKSEGKGDWVSYLLQTPLLVTMINIVIILLVLIFALNKRFGLPIFVKNPETNNSEAYIQALAAVLRKAESNNFVLENIAKSELLRIQKALGLGGKNLVDQETLIIAWREQTKTSPQDLIDLLKLANRSQKISQGDLLIWLNKLKLVHQKLNIR